MRLLADLGDEGLGGGFGFGVTVQRPEGFGKAGAVEDRVVGVGDAELNDGRHGGVVHQPVHLRVDLSLDEEGVEQCGQLFTYGGVGFGGEAVLHGGQNLLEEIRGLAGRQKRAVHGADDVDTVTYVRRIEPAIGDDQTHDGKVGGGAEVAMRGTVVQRRHEVARQVGEVLQGNLGQGAVITRETEREMGQRAGRIGMTGLPKSGRSGRENPHCAP
ncbi:MULTISPECIES: hypothetical protein [unclassified Roseovarius]|uniref:hypothetical protein n=1 Tax=unclassified Roseovarius TaxID=2614913 RepID=UPI00273DB32C|nr:hypothetical protein [Roseovarius sp. MMSF_3350]